MNRRFFFIVALVVLCLALASSAYAHGGNHNSGCALDLCNAETHDDSCACYVEGNSDTVVRRHNGKGSGHKHGGRH